MPQLTPNVPEYAKRFSVELFEIGGNRRKNRRKRRNRRKEIDEIDEKNRRKRRNRRKKSTKTTKSTNKNYEIDEKVGCYVGLIFVVFVRQISSNSSNILVDFVDFVNFVNFVDFRIRQVWRGGHFFGPLFRDFFRTSLRGWGGGVGLVCGVWGQWHQGLAAVRRDKDTEEGQRAGKGGGWPGWALSSPLCGLGTCRFCNAKDRENFPQKLEKIEFLPPIRRSDFVLGKRQEQGSFFFWGVGACTRLLPLRTHTRLT